MPLTQEQKNFILTKSGYDPMKWDVTDDGYIDPKKVVAAQPAVTDNDIVQPKLPKPAGPGETFFNEALHAVPASVGGGLGVAGGAALGSFGGPIGTVVGGILGGLGGGIGTSMAQEAIESRVAPEMLARRAANLQANPNAGTLGRLAAIPAGGFMPNPMNVLRAGSSAARIPGLMMGKGVPLAAPEIANLANVGGGAAIGTGVGVGQQLAQGVPIGDALTSRETLEALIGGTLFNDPNAIGKKLGFQPVDWNPVQRPSLTANKTQLAEQVRRHIAEQNKGVSGELQTVPTLRQWEFQQAKAEVAAQEAEAAAQQAQSELAIQQAEARRVAAEKAKVDAEQAKAQAEIDAKKQAQLGMKLGQHGTAEAIMARGVSGPETVTRATEPIYFDAETGKTVHESDLEQNRADKLRQKLEPDIAQDEADAIQERLEKRNMNADTSDLAPAVRFKSGNVWRGKAGESHAPLYMRWRESNIIDMPVEGFADSKGNFYTRQEANQKFGIMFSNEVGNGMWDYMHEGGNVPQKAEVEAAMKAKGLPMEASVKYLGTAVEQGAKHPGITTEIKPTVDSKGNPTYGSAEFQTEADKLKKVAVELNPEVSEISTPAHEQIGHAFRRFLKGSSKAGHRELIARGERLAKPLLEKVNRERAARGEEPWDVEELLATQQGYEAILRHPEVSGEGALKQWFRDFKAQMKQQLGTSNEADIRRIIDLLYHSDTTLTAGQVKGVGGKVDMARTKEERAAQDKARREQYKAENAELGPARSSGVSPATYPKQETNVPRMPERALGTVPRTSTGEVKQGPYLAKSTEQRIPIQDIVSPDQESYDVIYHEITKAVQSAVHNIRARTGFWFKLKKSDIEAVRSDAYEDVLANGVDRGVSLKETLVRRAHDAVNRAVDDFIKNGGKRTSSYDAHQTNTETGSLKELAESGKAESVEEEMAFQDALDEEAPNLPPEEQSGTELPSRVASKEELASLEEMFAPKEAAEKPVKRKIKSQRKKAVSKNLKNSVAWYLERFDKQLNDELIPMHENAVKEEGAHSDSAEEIKDRINQIQEVIKYLRTKDLSEMVDLGKVEKRNMSATAKTPEQREAVVSYLRDNLDSIAKEIDSKYEDAVMGDNITGVGNAMRAMGFKSTLGQYISQNALDSHPMAGDLMLRFIKPFVSEKDYARMQDVLKTAREALGLKNMEFNEDKAARIANAKREASSRRYYREMPHLENPYEKRNMSAYDIPVVGPLLRKTIASEVEKLKTESPEAAKGATNFYEKMRLYRGQLEQQTVNDIKAARSAKSAKEWVTQNNPDYEAVVKWLDLKQDGLNPGFDLTPVQQEIADAVRSSVERSRALSDSVPSLAKDEPLPEYHLPHVMDRNASRVLSASPKSPEAKAYKDDFIRYRTEEKGQPMDKALADWKVLRSQFNIPESGNIANNFHAVDKAVGMGIPRSMREGNLIDRMSRYNRRYARRVAYEEAIGGNEAMKNEFFGEEGVASTKSGGNVIQDIFGIREHEEATRNAAGGLVRALMLGPLTGAKDVVAGQFLGLQHMTLDQVLPAKQASIRDYKENFKRAMDTGVVRDNIGALESGEGGWNSIQSILERSRDIINVAQGRQLLENVSRTLNFGEGRHLVLDAFNAMKGGRLTETRRAFLDNFMPDWAKYRDKELPVQALDEAAARYVESVQGTYDQRGLPSWMLKGSFSPVFSLARWSVEKFNNFTKHVVEPASNGNYKPLLMATLGGVLGGEAISKLVEMSTGKKDRIPKAEEIAASKEKLGLVAYKAAALASMSGYAGVLGDVSKSVMDKYYGNRGQTWNNPLLDAMSTAAEDLSFINEALQEGQVPDVVDTIDMFLSDYIQAYRIAMSQMSSDKKEKLADTNKRRDLRVYQMGEGLPSGQSATVRPNPLLDKEMKQFKRTDDLQEAAPLARELVKNVIAENKGNPERMRAELSKLRRNSYQIVPSPERSPMAFTGYRKFLTETQGPEVASERIKDYMIKNAKNRAKSSMIPSL